MYRLASFCNSTPITSHAQESSSYLTISIVSLTWFLLHGGRPLITLYVVMQVNSGQHGNEYEGNDLNVEEAWLQGLTGCNVTVAVVDDGE